MDVPDQITKQVELRAKLPTVWEAIANPEAFGAWFGVAFKDPFKVGAWTHGHIVPTTVDPEVAKMQAPHTGSPCNIHVERMEAPRVFAFQWHPYGVDPTMPEAPMTLVTFELQAMEQGTRLTITESGFSKIPLELRAAAFTANEGGWAHQCKLIARYLERDGT